MHAHCTTSPRTFECPTCHHNIEGGTYHWTLPGGVIVCPRCDLTDCAHCSPTPGVVTTALDLVAAS